MPPARMNRLLRHFLLFVSYGVLGSLLTLLIVLTVTLNGRTDLDVWHLADLDKEFTADSEISTFEEYVLLENSLFVQLDEEVYAKTGLVGDDVANRYKRGSLSDPSRWPRNWNRSFELPTTDPRASVLLLHGLSDSPYSLRTIADRMHATNHHVLGLRIPGHGTAPSGLVEVRWQDMAAAVEIAVKHLAQLHPHKPIYIVGYSNGAALAVHYALATLEKSDLPEIDRLALISPEIGVTKAAAFAVWQARLGHFLGLEKLAWNSIEPEYDPFKYGSFAINAGDLSYRITGEIQRLLGKESVAGKLSAMPSIQAFSSIVDATVLAPALIRDLLGRLPAGGHELVIYDVNSTLGLDYLYKWDPSEMFETLRKAGVNRYNLSLVSNRRQPGGAMIERRWRVGMGGDDYIDTPLKLSWPSDVYSLSHVALPIPPGDPLYGGMPDESSPGLKLGALALRGERGVLQISPASMLRLRWNPFYAYQEEKMLEFFGVASTLAEP